MAHYTGGVSIPHATYDEFRNATLGNSYDYDGYYQCQCWDFCQELYYQYGLTLYTGPNGWAVECWTVSRSLNAVHPFTDIFSGMQNIKRGDMLVFYGTSGNPAGHICFADENYNGTTRLNCLGQNQRGSSTLGVTVDNLNLLELVGYFRNTNWQGTPPPTPTQRKRFPWVLVARKFRSGMR